MPDEPIIHPVAAVAIPTAVMVSPSVPDGSAQTIAHINLIIIRCLSGILVVFALGMVLLQWASWHKAASDPGGVNAIREDIKTFVTFILGLFSGIVQAKIIGATPLARNGGPKP